MENIKLEVDIMHLPVYYVLIGSNFTDYMNYLNAPKLRIKIACSSLKLTGQERSHVMVCSN